MLDRNCQLKKIILLLCAVMLTACSPCSVNVGVGYSYILNVPESHMTGHEQFHLKIEIEKPITDNLSLFNGWTHYSNGAQIGIGRFPNYGLDVFGSHFEYKFQF